MTPEERKAIAMRHADSALCDRIYPHCCSYHEGFDDALALLVRENPTGPLYGIEGAP